MTLVSTSRELAVEYRYIFTDMLTDTLLAEFPLVGVTYSRKLDEAGTFSGSLPITPEIANQDVYNTTMPGKTSVYVLRNNVCVWGGMVVGRKYDAKEKTLDIEADEFVSYLDRRVLWKTWDNSYECTVEITNGVSNGKTIRLAKVTLKDGESVVVTGGEKIKMGYVGEDYTKFNREHTVLTSPAPDPGGTFFYFAAYYQPLDQKSWKAIPLQTIETAFVEFKQSAQEFVKQLKDELAEDFLGIDIPTEYLEPGSREYYEVSKYSRTGNVAYITTTQPHRLAPGQMIKVRDVATGFNTPANEYTEVLATFEDDSGDPNGSLKFSYASTGADVLEATAARYSSPITAFYRYDNIVTIKTQFNHNLTVGDIVYIDGTKQQFDEQYFVVSRIGTSSGTDPKIFQFYNAGEKLNDSTAPSGSIFSRIPVIQRLSAGSFVKNSDIGLSFVNQDEVSTARAYQDVLRGHELATVKELIDKFADDLVGFNYRIDCEFNEATNSFSKKLVFLSLRPKSLRDAIAGLPNGILPEARLPEIEYFDAQGRIFEYPGNVSSVSFVESIEEAATRVWLQGDNEAQGASEGEPALPYGAAADHVLLKEGWPLLDKVMKKEKVYNKRDLYRLAKLEISRAQPPISTFSITVNGTLTPDISTYKPGDWCVVVIEDEFIQQRLSNYIETKNAENPRNVFLRKINGFSVSLSNNPVLPEEVNLELITEPSVDIVGRETWRWDDKEDDDLLDQALEG